MILVSPRWGSRIKSFGLSPCNRVVLLILNHNNMDFGICSIYATNDHNKISMFWSWLSSLTDIPWIFGGDFNMLENQEDKMGGLPFSWKE